MKFLNWAIGVLVVLLILRGVQQHSPAPPQDDWFRAQVVDRETPVLVKFGAGWCGPCKQLEPVLDAAQADLNGRVKVVRIDVDERPELAAHYGISSIPRLMLFDHGKVLATAYGFGDAEELTNWVDRQID